MKNKKLIGSFVVMVFIIMVLSSIGNSRNLNNSPEISQGEIEPDKLIKVDFPIYIDGNWSEYIDQYDWCSGSGTEENPYIIEGIHVTNEKQTAHISIEKAERFIIRNVTVSNYAKPYGDPKYAGIHIGKGEYGLIDNCTIINCSHGISLAEAKDSIKITNNRFIGSHNDSKTGLGCAIVIHEAKGVNISYNNIDNFYSGIVVYDAEEIYVHNNTIKTNFGYISNTGIYFYTVGNSEIIGNEFYGCNFTGHEYDIISSGIGGLATSDLINCYNLTIHRNRFYDLQGNLIVPDVPDIPDIPEIIDVDTPNYWIFILIGVVGSLVGISIFLKLRKRIN